MRLLADDAKVATALAATPAGEPASDTVELNSQLVLQTRRAALMESQVEVLEGKQRALTRFRTAVGGYLEALEALPDSASQTGLGSGEAGAV